MADPFILLDDARACASGAGAGARLFESPLEVFRALRPEEVAETLAAAEAAQAESGGTLAGFIGYEAGLALEPKLRPLAGARTGAAQGGQAAGLWRDRQSTFDSAAAFVS